GLGSTKESIQDFEKAMNQLGYEVQFIDIPGQYLNRDVRIRSEQDLIEWLSSEIPVGSNVIAFSMGADIAIRYHSYLQASRLIILDGGIIDYDLMNITLKDDIAMMKSYIEENQLDMNSETISKLISLLRENYIDIFHAGLNIGTLLLLSDHPDFVYEYKKNKIEENHDNMNHIFIQFIKDTSHEIYVEKPKVVAKAIMDWLQRTSNKKNS
ncbi:MAG: alpha/beta hydrolase, partial [Solobacterium sp.]|nr:alpha/beta hydrolase [Solobacterium sp.]